VRKQQLSEVVENINKEEDREKSTGSESSGQYEYSEPIVKGRSSRECYSKTVLSSSKQRYQRTKNNDKVE